MSGSTGVRGRPSPKSPTRVLRYWVAVSLGRTGSLASKSPAGRGRGRAGLGNIEPGAVSDPPGDAAAPPTGASASVTAEGPEFMAPSPQAARSDAKTANVARIRRLLRVLELDMTFPVPSSEGSIHATEQLLTTDLPWLSCAPGQGDAQTLMRSKDMQRIVLSGVIGGVWALGPRV